MLKVTTRTTVDQILTYAREELGVTLETEGKDKAALIAEVRSIESDQGIDNEGATNDEDAGGDDEEAVTAVTSVAAVTQSKKNPSKVEINIHQPPAPDEGVEPDSHCELALNGRIYQLQYGVDLIVEYGVYDILKNAVQTKYFQKKNQQTGTVETHSKQVQRYPFNVVRFID